MAGWLFYFILDRLPLVASVLLVTSAGVVSSIFSWSRWSHYGHSGLLKKVDMFLKNRSRPYFSSGCWTLDRELRDDEELLNGSKEPVPPEVYRAVGIYAAVSPLLAFLLASDATVLEESSTCATDLDCFISQDDYLFFLKQLVTNCSTLNTTDTVICYTLAFNCITGLAHMGGLMIVLQLFLKVSSLIFQIFCKHPNIIRGIPFLLYFLLGSAVGVIFVVRDVVPSREIVKLLCFLIFLPIAFSIPWEKLYTAQEAKTEDKQLVSHEKKGDLETKRKDDSDKIDSGNDDEAATRCIANTALEESEETDSKDAMKVADDNSGAVLTNSKSALDSTADALEGGSGEDKNNSIESKGDGDHERESDATKSESGLQLEGEINVDESIEKNSGEVLRERRAQKDDVQVLECVETTV